MNAIASLTSAANTDAQRLDVAEIAKQVRATIKAQTKAGKLPAGLECSVKISRYSMGCSLSLTVTAAPFNVLNVDRVIAAAGNPHAYPLHSIHSPQAEELLAKLEAIVDVYHRNDSDLSTDYYNVNFSKHIEISWKLQAADRAERLAELAEGAQ